MKKELVLTSICSLLIFGCSQSNNTKGRILTFEDEAREYMESSFSIKLERTDLVYNEGGIVFQSGDSVIVISQMISYSSDKNPKRESFEFIYYKPTNCDTISYGYVHNVKEGGGTTMQILDYEVNRFNKFVLNNGGKEVSFDFIAPKRLASLAIMRGIENRINKAEL